jgi:ATP-dependent RNA helicase RhlE
MAPQAPDPPAPIASFTDLPLREDVLRQLDRLGFVRPTPIQAQAIPVALDGRDVLGVAQTGTGKTLAFLVPILHGLEPSGRVQALVVCPTRELAQQVGTVAREVGEPLGVRTALLYGGTGQGPQRQALEDGADIVVGTPGRLMDFLGGAWLRPRYIRTLVLDEADRMLDMGFIDDIRTICARMPMSRQTMLFSATMPAPIVELTDRFMLEPVTVRVSPRTAMMAEGIEERLYELRPQDKPEVLRRVLDDYRGQKVLVFTATREATSEVARGLRRAGHEVVSLSSLLSQTNRDNALSGFRRGEYDVMVATDVAARGLDVVDIDVVVNYDVPHAPEDYVHRVGRTARGERTGLAVTFATPQEQRRVDGIEKLTGHPVPRATVEGIEPPPSAGRRGRKSSRGGSGRTRPGGGGGSRGRGGSRRKSGKRRGPGR